MPETEDVLDGLFFMTTHIYDSSYKPDLNAVYQFYLKDTDNAEYAFYLTIKDQAANYGKGVHENPDLKVYAGVNLWIDMASKKKNPIVSYLKKEYKMVGNPRLMGYLGSSLRRDYSNKSLKELGPEIDNHEKLTLWSNIKNIFHTAITDYIYRNQIYSGYTRVKKWEKPKDVIVLNGSPRKERAFTNFYLSRFIEGMEKAGANVELVNLADKKQFNKTEACRGCYACWKGKYKEVCVIKDDYTELLDRVENAKLTVYATPLYVDTVSAVMKDFMDRHFIYLTPYMNKHRKLTRHPMQDEHEKYITLFSVCGFSEVEQFKPLVNMFHAHARNSHKPLLASILRPASEGAYLNPFCWPYMPGIMASLEEAGRCLVEYGSVPSSILKKISSTPIPKHNWHSGPNLYWKLKNKGTTKPWVFLSNHNNYKSKKHGVTARLDEV